MRHLNRLVLLALMVTPVVASMAPGCSDDNKTGVTGSTASVTGASSSGDTGSGGMTGAGGMTGSSGTSTGGGSSAGGASGSGGSGGSGGLGSGGATAGAGGGLPPPPPPTEMVPCLGKFYECGDLIDNDGDGLVDYQDPDCLGPCDNTENSYYGGIPGQAGPACTVDCYFDSDSGSGNDDCHWNHKCDPHEMAPGYYPEPHAGAQCEYDPNANTSGTPATCDELNMTQSQACHDYCGPLTPNGCDCFGCCELPAESGKYVWLGSTDINDKPSCTAAGLNDPDQCHPCKPVDACLNTCGHCELCLGKPELPPDCFPQMGAGGGSGVGGASGAGGGSTSGAGGAGGSPPPPPPPQCPPGIQPCGLPGQLPCPGNYYCITGCCQSIPG